MLNDTSIIAVMHSLDLHKNWPFVHIIRGWETACITLFNLFPFEYWPEIMPVSSYRLIFDNLSDHYYLKYLGFQSSEHT
jgi:hypothetical protein